MKETVISLSEFIRVKICIFICAIGMSGYLLFNPLNKNLIFVALTSFFGAAGAYSFNNIRDKEEDIINRKKITPFISSNKGLLITFTCFLLGIIFSFFLTLYSIFFSLLGVVVSVIYSFFKFKKYFLIKNLYTAFSVGVVFLVGATNINIEIVWYYFLISFFILIISMISDLRDYTGDKFCYINTLAVSLGYDTTKKIIFLLLGVFLLLVLYFSKLFILLPSIIVMFYFLYKNNPSFAHSCGGYSFILLSFWGLIV